MVQRGELLPSISWGHFLFYTPAYLVGNWLNFDVLGADLLLLVSWCVQLVCRCLIHWGDHHVDLLHAATMRTRNWLSLEHRLGWHAELPCFDLVHLGWTLFLHRRCISHRLLRDEHRPLFINSSCHLFQVNQAWSLSEVDLSLTDLAKWWPWVLRLLLIPHQAFSLILLHLAKKVQDFAHLGP